MSKRCWLMKSEPDSFGIADLERVKIEPWTGVRNFQARNYMRDEMRVGDDVLFYHSNAVPPGAAGLARVHRAGVVDETQFEPSSKYYDPRARRDAPVWICVDVVYVATFPRLVSLDELHAEPRLAEMLVLRRGMRLSVLPVSTEHFEVVKEMSVRPAPVEAEKAKPRPALPAAAKAAVASAARRKAKPAAKAKPRPAAKAKPRPAAKASKGKHAPSKARR